MEGWKETETPRAGLQHPSATVIIDHAMGPSIYPSLSLFRERITTVKACPGFKSFYSSLYLSISIHPSIHPLYLPIHPSIYLFVSLSIDPAICLSIRPSIHLSLSLYLCLTIHPSIYLSICPSLQTTDFSLALGRGPRSGIRKQITGVSHAHWYK